MPEWFGGSTLNPDMIMPRADQWKPQWDRVLRWYGRMNQVRIKCQRSALDMSDIDLVIAFFQNCYHLRDWIQSCRPDCREKIDALFADNFEMAGCRDLCNGFKHKALTRAALDSDFNLYREYDHFAVEVGQNPIQYRVAFADGDDLRKYDLFDFGERCFRLWDKFILELDARSALEGKRSQS